VSTAIEPASAEVVATPGGIESLDGAPRVPAIEARGLIAVHGGPVRRVAALRGLDLTVEPGEVAAVVGPSGSGKTTLLRLLAGIERPTAGSVAVFGVDLETATGSELRRHRTNTVAIVEQHYRRALSPYAPVSELVELPLAVRGVAAPERRARVAELLRAVGLADRAGAYARQLSGGEQQRVAVAAALAIRPRLLLADEPTGELDRATASTLLELLRDLVRAEGTTCLVVTHDDLVEGAADRVVVIRDGRAVAERIGPPSHPARRLVDILGWQAPVLDAASNAEVTDGVSPQAVALHAVADARPGPAVSAIELDAVVRTYGEGRGVVPALRGVSARFPAGGFHVVTGPSGSGKSTLLRLVAGLDRPDSGRVVVLGQDVGSLDRESLARFRAERVGIAEQARGLVPFLTALENVALGYTIRREAAGAGGPRVSRSVSEEAPPAARQALARLGIVHLEASRPDDLSAGERTRVAIARAIVGEPALLLLDEPTATLDRANARRVAALLRRLGNELTVVAATHDEALIEAASERLDLAMRPA
jgi:ABC-type lipoprotein export system ATPase subunit